MREKAMEELGRPRRSRTASSRNRDIGKNPVIDSPTLKVLETTKLAHEPYVPSHLSHQINSRFVQAITDAHPYVSRVQEKCGSRGFRVVWSPCRVPDVALSKAGPIVESLGVRVCAPDEAVEGLEYFNPSFYYCRDILVPGNY
ncbi:hypothetical protein Sjap_006843 [Stephania japonica]|uniref:Uncharacterized protein n=1 Tax=Stephania japonica TaxID=461633 RepID=A0AAP0K981_9MAGN